MKRIILSILVFVSAIGLLQGQAEMPVISFETLNHNFGEIKEEGGLAEYTFVFRNTGKKDLIINAVNTSCGCTVPQWSKEPIPPQGSGSIKVSYNPLRRPGSFKKSIEVKSNADKNRIVLYIEGLVIPKPKTFEDEYPIIMSSIRLSTNHLSLLNIIRNQKKSGSLNVINMSDQNVTITIPDAPDNLSFSFQPETLQPNQKGIITVSYDASLVDDWGFNYQSVNLYINGSKVTRPNLTVSATLIEDFSHLTPLERSQAARMVPTELKYDFGSVKQGEKIEHDFLFKNGGKQPLLIRKIITTCNCLTAEPSAYEIPPGKEGKIHVIFDSARKSGTQNQTITVITNDPAKTNHLLRLVGNLESPSK